jgi:predicted dehydrogenase
LVFGSELQRTLSGRRTVTDVVGPGKRRFRAYAALAADVADGTHTVPDFDDAVLRNEVIDAIERSASTGKRVKV